MADAAGSTATEPASQQNSKEAPAKPEGLAAKAAGAAAGTEPETPPEPKKHTPNPKVREFAALTKKEREVRALMAQQRQEAAEIAAWRELRANPKANAEKILKAAGLTYDDITEHYVRGSGDDKPSPRHSELEEKLASYHSEVEKLRAELQKKEEDKAVSNYIDDIKKVAQSQDSFELIREYDAYQDVYELIDLRYQETGEILDKEEACRMIEDVLYEEKSAEAQKLRRVKKLRQQLAEEKAQRTDDDGSSPEPPPKPIATGAKTLTSELAATAGANPPPPKPLSDDDHWASLLARARAKG